MSSSSTFDTRDFTRFVRLNAAPYLGLAGDARCEARKYVSEAVAALLPTGPSSLIALLPGLLGETFGEFGWAWNGFYGLRPDGALHLASAHGPPVCSQLDASGGALSSGMCFDSLALNQTLAAYDTKLWPGYVSCDAESQLGTASGIVVPLRNPAGTPIGCWDLDCVESIEAGDVRFMDVLISTLARCVEFQPASFGSGF